MSLTSTRTALKSALEGTGIDRVYDKETDKPEVPCIMVGNPIGTYDDAFGGALTFVFPVLLLVSRAVDASAAIGKIDPFIDPTVTTSVPAKVNAVTGAACVGFTEYGKYEFGDTIYAGITFEVQVLAG